MQRQQLILAFDVGTTYSGITYCFFDNGQVQKVQGATRFPGQAEAGQRKIPSIIYYDAEGKVRAVGGEAIDKTDTAVSEGWTKAEWFKLHLVPSAIPKNQKIPPLPPNKTAIEVFADFLKYLLQCAKAYFVDSHGPGGQIVWEEVQDNLLFILSHPNGWSGLEQSKLRNAAIMGGLIPDTSQGRARVTFVTEGEASLHFCVSDTKDIQKGTKAIIIDAGGGTIDISSYKCTGLSPKRFEETSPSQCHYRGSVFVTSGAKTILEAKLDGSQFATDLGQICEEFDQKTKRIFEDSTRNYSISFGSLRDNDVKHGIVRGKLSLKGTDIAPLFDPSIDCICETVLKMHAADPTGQPPDIYLVGGFAASPWLYSQLQDRLKSHGFRFCRPDGHVNKAVADGAISFYLDRFVKTRAVRSTIGTFCSTRFDISDPEHVERAHTVITGLSGVKKIPRIFTAIVHKGTKLEETNEFREEFTREVHSRFINTPFKDDIVCYEGILNNPRWPDIEPDKFKTRCTVINTLDLSRIDDVVERRTANGGLYFKFDFSVILKFGGTEWVAQIAWLENGVEKRGPATLVYEEDSG